jgi:glycosyltransferase involved in cell wall biosynthesis
LKILHVLTEPRGGGGVYAVTLARAARERGDEVRFLSPLPLAQGEDAIPLRLSRPRSVAAACRAADLVHFHGVRSGLLRPLIGNRTAVLTTHGLHKLRAARGFRRPPVRALNRFVLARADAVVCTSEAERNEVIELDGALERRARVVCNGVPPAAVPSQAQRIAIRQRLGLAADAPVLLFVGGLRFQKNPQLAVAAARLARSRLPGLVLLVAGEGPLDDELRTSDDSEPWLRLLGGRTDIPDLLAAADAVLNTSRWEGMSLALLEALWRGRPAVATDAPGNPEAVGDAGLIAPQEAQAIAEAIVRIFATDGLLGELSNVARTRAEALFDERRMVTETLAVYDEALQRSGR